MFTEKTLPTGARIQVTGQRNAPVNMEVRPFWPTISKHRARWDKRGRGETVSLLEELIAIRCNRVTNLGSLASKQ